MPRFWSVSHTLRINPPGRRLGRRLRLRDEVDHATQNTRLQRRHRRRSAHHLDAARPRRPDRCRHRCGRPVARPSSSRSTTSSSRTRTSTTSPAFRFWWIPWAGMRGAPITVHATEQTLDILRDAPIQLEDLAGLHADPERAGAVTCATRDPRGRAGRARRPHDHAAARQSRGAGGWLSPRQRARRAWCSPATRRPTTRCGSVVNEIENLRYLIIETAFSNAERELAIAFQALVPEHAGRGARQAEALSAKSSSRT